MALEWQDNGPKEVDSVVLNGQGVRDLAEMYDTSGLSIREVPADYEDDDQVDFFGVVGDGFGEELDCLADELERDRAYLKGRVVDSSTPGTL